MANLVSADVLRTTMPKCQDPDRWVEPLQRGMAEFEIDTPHRTAAFLAQLAHESAELRRLVENLDYSAPRLTEVWPSRFLTEGAAAPFAHTPEKLANKVYACRLGNGAEESGDGWRFRGRGLIPLAGRTNYRQAAAAVSLPLEIRPELLEEPLGAALAAAWYWKSHGCNALADDVSGDADDEDFRAITIKINGATSGLNERRAYWRRARAALGLG